jgi:A/G-specific adenine glycosylase
MERFPDIPTLARASQDEVLSAWEGLGYYSRARSLHKTARLLVDANAGELPESVDALRKLPGIGPYTAAAIASIAFGLDVPALDGNIRRVLARVFNVDVPARSPEGESILLQHAAENLPPGQAGDYNQALMDLGAAICTPRNPRCSHCPVAALCQARILGIQEQRPVLERKPETPHYIVTAAVIHRDFRVLIAQRPAAGLLGGLWEFPGGKQQEGEDLPECLKREISEELGVVVDVGEQVGVFRHAYSHFKVTLHAFHCRLVSGEPEPVEADDIRWVEIAALTSFPMGKIDRLISTVLQATGTLKSC